MSRRLNSPLRFVSGAGPGTYALRFLIFPRLWRFPGQATASKEASTSACVLVGSFSSCRFVVHGAERFSSWGVVPCVILPLLVALSESRALQIVS
jgi:hypothetical protein